MYRSSHECGAAVGTWWRMEPRARMPMVRVRVRVRVRVVVTLSVS